MVSTDMYYGFLRNLVVKNPPAIQEMHRRCGFDPWVRKIPWRRKWQPTPVLLPEKFHGQRSLEGYSPWGCNKSDMTKQLHWFTGFNILQLEVKVLVTQSCPTLGDPMD